MQELESLKYEVLLMAEAVLILLFSISCGGLGQIFFKKGTKSLPSLEHRFFANFPEFFGRAFLQPFIWLGIVAMTLNFFSWLLVLSKADVSWALPMRSLQYLWVALLAIFFLKEKVNNRRWIGIAFITVGIFFMLRSWGG